jgi:hypothetical protein
MQKSYLAAALATSVWMSGCASGGVGLVESPMWHSTAPMETKIAHFQKKCAAYGHQAGSEGMTKCLQRSMEASESNANDRMKAIGSMSQQNRSVTCTTIGNTTTCR